MTEAEMAASLGEMVNRNDEVNRIEYVKENAFFAIMENGKKFLKSIKIPL